MFCAYIFAAQFCGGESVDFETQIAPILAERCLGCHSPGIDKGDLSLATTAGLIENDYIVAGAPGDSHLIDVISSTDGMPPSMPAEGDPLTDEQVQLFRQWVQEGANWPADTVVREKPKAGSDWWSLQPLNTTTAIGTTIDEFVDARLKSAGLHRNPHADRATLIRRATYDLTGLPPSTQAMTAFIDDQRPNAYELLIDRLLASPDYGQRWGRHWLDVVRFGESNGFERNVIINELWPFRDYVIKSLNEDKPFDQFIREHIAGDVIGKGAADSAVGTAFLVAGPYDNVNNQDVVQTAQIRANTLDEMIIATSQSFLGMTVGCARCHDHKFDPITQEDYYAMYATFAGVRHGAVQLATEEETKRFNAAVKDPRQRLQKSKPELQELETRILQRALGRLADYQLEWDQPSVRRSGTEETFDPIDARFVRLVCEAQDVNLKSTTAFGVDEFEVWTSTEGERQKDSSRNVALAKLGGIATGRSRINETFPESYAAKHVNDGKFGARFIAAGSTLQIELAERSSINRVVFSSARNASDLDQRKFTFVAEYRIEVSDDGNSWTTVADGSNRKPRNDDHRDWRLMRHEASSDENGQMQQLRRNIAQAQRQVASIRALPRVWIGKRVEQDAKGPFTTFIGGSPQRPGAPVVPKSPSAFDHTPHHYTLDASSNEADRRHKLADWIASDDNPVTARVLANRVWHYHFGTGIVDTPSDLGYMGGRPTHPMLLDHLASELIRHGWRLKPLHRQIMLSDTYRQSSEFRPDAAATDRDARLLWRFPPRRLSAEEIRDTLLSISDQLDQTMDGPGFRLYRYMNDNVSTYAPLDRHESDTYRRAVYHQNARASVVDLMNEFDQPDCTFSTPRRVQTTTPLQALTMLNHSFTLDMADAFASRLDRECGFDQREKIRTAFQHCFGRTPEPQEIEDCQAYLQRNDLVSLCRVLLNASEVIYVH